MRDRLLNYLRAHPKTLNIFWKIMHVAVSFIGFFVPVKDNTMLITSFSGRKYDDSPKALYEEIITRHYFDDWDIIWAFIEPERFEIPRGRKIKIDTIAFFKALLYSRVWISNSGMDRNLDLSRKKTVKIETWHGTPLKKIGADQNSGTLGNYKPPKQIDRTTIRCAQSTFDRDIFSRIFSADKNSFLLCDLPRNDNLVRYNEFDNKDIKEALNIPENRTVILYMPTYREYLVNTNKQTYIKPPITFEKWEKELGADYVVLVRAHYAVSEAMNLPKKGMFMDVSDYPTVNDLYSVSDIMISDYSSAFFDFAILGKPMMCFAYDKAEYEMKRGLYLDLEGNLPCRICMEEDELINEIKTLDYNDASKATILFKKKYTPYAGNASQTIVDTLIKRLGHN